MDGFDLIVTPDADDPDAATLYVDGELDGAPRRFRIDTGAARSCVGLDERTAALHVVGEGRTAGLFGEHTGEELVVASLRLGPIVARDLTLARVHQDDPALANLIGMDVLRHHRLHVRIAAGRVEVDPAAAPVRETHPLFLDRTHHPYVDVRLGGAAGSAVWDSGAGMTIVDLAFAARAGAAIREVGVSRGTDATGATMETPLLELTGLELGGCVLPPHRAAGVDLAGVNATIERPMDLILGYPTQRLADWWFDFPGLRWALTALHEEA